jgi:heptosyltransferase-2
MQSGKIPDSGHGSTKDGNIPLNNTPISRFGHIAIIQTAFIGDVVLAMPLAKAVKETNPDASLTFVTTPVSVSIPKMVKEIDNAIAFDKRNSGKGWQGIKRMAESLKALKTDCIITPHRSLRSTLISRLSGCDYSVGFDKNSLSFLYKNRIPYRKDFHEIERNLSLLEAFGLNLKFSGFPEAQISFNDANFAENLLLSAGVKRPYIVISPGSVWPTKRWKPEHFAKLADMFIEKGFSVVLTGSGADKDICDYISGKCSAANLAGKTNIPQTISIIKNSVLTVTNDSAPTHFAGFAGAPALTIYGPTSPVFGFYPRGKFDESISLEGLKCSPCRIHGSKKCPLGTHECMENLLPEYVFDKARVILDKSQN